MTGSESELLPGLLSGRLPLFEVTSTLFVIGPSEVTTAVRTISAVDAPAASGDPAVKVCVQVMVAGPVAEVGVHENGPEATLVICMPAGTVSVKITSPVNPAVPRFVAFKVKSNGCPVTTRLGLGALGIPNCGPVLVGVRSIVSASIRTPPSLSVLFDKIVSVGLSAEIVAVL